MVAASAARERRLARWVRPAPGRSAVTLRAGVRNSDRAIGAALMGVLARRHGDEGVPDRHVRLDLAGHAGQSLGAFALPGTEIRLCGTANDGVGKGMHGGLIVIHQPAPDDDTRGAARAGDVLVGNAAIYGATGGRLFVAGRAGERFAVRNSGATAVVEGVGDHGCEYMTGGTVVVLGPVGRNFGAGMTGGIAYVLDETRRLGGRVNHEHVTVSLPGDGPLEALHALVHEHHAETGSSRAAAILASWDRSLPRFRIVTPRSATSAVPVASHAAARPARHDRARGDSLAATPEPADSRPDTDAAGRDAQGPAILGA
jgi:glutamate synthase domain-containing protein 3